MVTCQRNGQIKLMDFGQAGLAGRAKNRSDSRRKRAPLPAFLFHRRVTTESFTIKSRSALAPTDQT